MGRPFIMINPLRTAWSAGQASNGAPLFSCLIIALISKAVNHSFFGLSAGRFPRFSSCQIVQKKLTTVLVTA